MFPSSGPVMAGAVLDAFGDMGSGKRWLLGW
jgi:hypothetical protein